MPDQPVELGCSGVGTLTPWVCVVRVFSPSPLPDLYFLIFFDFSYFLFYGDIFIHFFSCFGFFFLCLIFFVFLNVFFPVF